jgi:hypothetical protein
MLCRNFANRTFVVGVFLKTSLLAARMLMDEPNLPSSFGEQSLTTIERELSILVDAPDQGPGGEIGPQHVGC